MTNLVNPQMVQTSHVLGIFLGIVSKIKEWQPLLAGLLMVVAACILARAIARATRLRGSSPAKTKLNASRPDLRAAPRISSSDPVASSADIFQILGQLRSLVRSAVSALSLAKDAKNGDISSFYECIFNLQLDRSALPTDIPDKAQELLHALLGQINMLRLLVEKKAAKPEIYDALIKLNSSARNLNAVLSASNAKLPLAVQPSAKSRRDTSNARS